MGKQGWEMDALLSAHAFLVEESTLTVGAQLGQGCEGVVFKAVWKGVMDVCVKVREVLGWWITASCRMPRARCGSLAAA